MSNDLINRQYITIVPKWLSSLYLSQEVKITQEDLLSYRKLATITSSSDVCFYHWFLSKIDYYGYSMLNDFKLISSIEDNVTWLTENLKEYDKVSRELNHKFNNYVLDEKNTSTVPEDIRRSTFTVDTENPLAVILLTNEPYEGPEEENVQGLATGVIKALAKLVLAEELFKYDVFKRYVVM